MREEVCKLANELAKKRGGHPADYMGEAWETIQKRKGKSTKRVPIKKKKGEGKGDDHVDRHSEVIGHARGRVPLRTKPSHHSSFRGDARAKRFGKGMARGVGRGAVRMGGSALRETKDAVNFTKAPKDSVNFSGLFRKADPIPDIPESVKKMFKIW